MLLKIIVAALLIVIFYCLGSGLWYLVRGETGTVKVAKALTWRIFLSCVLFVFLIVAYTLGWIAPHGVIVVPTS